MSEKNIVHGSLKLENILIKYDKSQKTKYCFKITDYGEVRDIIETDDGNLITCGEDGSVNIIKIGKNNAFFVNGGKPTDYGINTILKLSDANYITGSDDGYLYIFKYQVKDTSLELIV